jgi:hypothetical protein
MATKGSTFKLNKAFNPNMDILRQGIQEAAQEAMRAAFAQAEEDAQGMYRWRKPGEYQNYDRNGKSWVWEVTGLSAASITGYVVGPLGDEKKPKALAGRRALRFHSNSDLTKINELDPSLMGRHSARKGRVIGVVTMYTAYAPYLQAKEITGGLWGIPKAGEPVTIEVLRVNWDAYYVPNIIRPLIEKKMGEVAARLK